MIFYNLQYGRAKQLHEDIQGFINDKLDINLELHEIADVYRLGKGKQGQNSPVLLRLTSVLKKKQILNNVRRLKGTGVAVSEDLSVEERLRNKILYNHYKAAILKNIPAKLFRSRVEINGKFFKVEDLGDYRLLAEKPGIPGSSLESINQPSTPTTDCNLEETLSQKDAKEARSVRGSKLESQADLVKETRSRTNSVKSTSSVERAVQKKATKNKYLDKLKIYKY